jgi:hypothetical protein
LHEQLQVAQHGTQLMREEHISLLRQSQNRQMELERENADMISSLALKEKELARVMVSYDLFSYYIINDLLNVNNVFINTT